MCGWMVSLSAPFIPWTKDQTGSAASRPGCFDSQPVREGSAMVGGHSKRCCGIERPCAQQCAPWPFLTAATAPKAQSPSLASLATAGVQQLSGTAPEPDPRAPDLRRATGLQRPGRLPVRIRRVQLLPRAPRRGVRGLCARLRHARRHLRVPDHRGGRQRAGRHAHRLRLLHPALHRRRRRRVGLHHHRVHRGCEAWVQVRPAPQALPDGAACVPACWRHLTIYLPLRCPPGLGGTPATAAAAATTAAAAACLWPRARSPAGSRTARPRAPSPPRPAQWLPQAASPSAGCRASYKGQMGSAATPAPSAPPPAAPRCRRPPPPAPSAACSWGAPGSATGESARCGMQRRTRCLVPRLTRRHLLQARHQRGRMPCHLRP